MPRKYPADVIGIRQFGSGFNEAGADAPEIPAAYRAVSKANWALQ